MKFIVSCLCVALAISLAGCKPRPATLIEGGYDQAEMDAAIARARAEVDRFITEFQAKNGENFAVKEPISDNGKVEHFWLINVTYKDGVFEGVIDNEPGIVSNVKIGDKRSLKKEEISDWMFLRNGKIHGNYTMRPLLKTMPESEAKKFREMLAD